MVKIVVQDVKKPNKIDTGTGKIFNLNEILTKKIACEQPVNGYSQIGNSFEPFFARSTNSNFRNILHFLYRKKMPGSLEELPGKEGKKAFIKDGRRCR